jgi:hypothetical protein
VETITLFSNLIPPYFFWSCRFRVPLSYVGPLSNIWHRVMTGEQTMTNVPYNSTKIFVSRLHIPVWQESILGAKKQKKQDSWGFLFFLCFPEEFFTGKWFWKGSPEFPFLAAFTGFFCRNSGGAGIPVFTPDSSGFLRIPAGFLFPSKLSGSGQRLKKALC